VSSDKEKKLVVVTKESRPHALGCSKNLLIPFFISQRFEQILKALFIISLASLMLSLFIFAKSINASSLFYYMLL
jgi:hypothetical protein